MLKRAIAIVCSLILGFTLLSYCQVSFGDECTAGANTSGLYDTELKASLSCPTSSGGGSGSGGSGESQDSRYRSGG